MAQKTISAALMPVNCASWLITTTPSSASAVNVRCWGCLDRRSTTGPHRYGNRRCGSWPGSTPSIWMIPAVAAAGWWTTWPERESRSVVIGCETSCAAWGYGRSTGNRAPRFQEIQQSAFPAWWISTQSRLWIRSGHGHHLHPAAEGVPLPGGDPGSVLQERTQLEALQQP